MTQQPPLTGTEKAGLGLAGLTVLGALILAVTRSDVVRPDARPDARPAPMGLPADGGSCPMGSSEYIPGASGI